MSMLRVYTASSYTSATCSRRGGVDVKNKNMNYGRHRRIETGCGHVNMAEGERRSAVGSRKVCAQVKCHRQVCCRRRQTRKYA